MNIDNTGNLFGIDEFTEDKNIESLTGKIISENKSENLSEKSDTVIKTPLSNEKTTDPKSKISTPLFSRSFVVSLTVLSLLIFLTIAIVSLHVKIQKTALSYELAAQTKLMRRLEKRKAMYELEYSFLRSKESISSKIVETGWKEITPHDIKFIKVIDNKKK